MLIKILIGNLAICILLTIIVSALFTKEKGNKPFKLIWSYATVSSMIILGIILTNFLMD